MPIYESDLKFICQCQSGFTGLNCEICMIDIFKELKKKCELFLFSFKNYNEQANYIKYQFSYKFR